MNSKITLVGFGVAGQLLLSHILQIVPKHQVCIVDPDFIGGDLARDYRAVTTNTMIGQKIESLKESWPSIATALAKRGELTDCVLLSDLIHDIRESSHDYARGCKQIYDTVKDISWSAETKTWTLNFQSRPSHTTSIVCICTGMEPRQEDYGIPIIPLRIALDPVALKQTVSDGQHVIVFGSSHSATLILKSLHELSISTTCIHHTKTPFKYDRDGNYGGIKQESAVIADAILRGEYKALTLVALSDVKGLSNAIRRADWCIQAVGFSPRIPNIIGIDSQPVWDPATGLTDQMTHIQCYGACVPNKTLVGTIAYPDISVGAFVDQIGVRWPLLKKLIEDISII